MTGARKYPNHVTSHRAFCAQAPPTMSAHRITREKIFDSCTRKAEFVPHDAPNLVEYLNHRAWKSPNISRIPSLNTSRTARAIIRSPTTSFAHVADSGREKSEQVSHHARKIRQYSKESKRSSPTSTSVSRPGRITLDQMNTFDHVSAVYPACSIFQTAHAAPRY